MKKDQEFYKGKVSRVDSTWMGRVCVFNFRWCALPGGTSYKVSACWHWPAKRSSLHYLLLGTSYRATEATKTKGFVHRTRRWEACQAPRGATNGSWGIAQK